MSKAFVVRSLTTFGFLFVASSVLSAQPLPGQFGPAEDTDWARAMIDKEMLNINYKSVARGQDVSFKIRVTNLYKEEMQITSLDTSCGCLSWDERKGPGPFVPIVVPSGQERTLTLRLNTIQHQGEKKNTRAFVTILEPHNGQMGRATILAEGYIRADVVLQPGSVNFGSVSPQTPATQQVSVSYAGRPDWKLLSAKCGSPYFDTEIVEKARINNGLASTVNYDIIVKLKDTAGVGVLHDQLVLVTDDLNNPQIPVQVEARVEPEIVVTGGDFGNQLIPGRPKEISIIVRTTKEPKKPFRIEKFERTSAEDTIKVRKSDELKVLHQLMLTFTPPNKPGPFEEELFLTISGQKEVVSFKVRGRIQELPAAN